MRWRLRWYLTVRHAWTRLGEHASHFQERSLRVGLFAAADGSVGEWAGVGLDGPWSVDAPPHIMEIVETATRMAAKAIRPIEVIQPPPGRLVARSANPIACHQRLRHRKPVRPSRMSA